MNKSEDGAIFKGYGRSTRVDTGGTGANFHRSLDGCQHGDIKIFKVDKDGVETLDHIEKAQIEYVDIGRGDDFKMQKDQCIDCDAVFIRPEKITWQIRCTPCAKEHKMKLAGKSRARARAKANAAA